MNFQSDIKIVNIFDINLSLEDHYLKIAFPNLEENTDFHPFCGLSLKNAKSMRFRNNEHNQNRIDFFNELQIDVSKVLQPELIHSKEVYDCSILENDFIAMESFLETSKLEQKIVNVQGDGIITKNQECFPTITVADCVPIWFYEPKTKVYGVVHSGWKGTGIIENALTSGVKIIATIHASNIFDLKCKPAFKDILNKKLFTRFVLLSNNAGVGTLEGVFDEDLRFIGV